MLVGGDNTYCFVKKTSRCYENEKPFKFMKKFPRQSKLAMHGFVPKKAKVNFVWHNRVHSPLVDTCDPKFQFNSHFVPFQPTVKQYDSLSL